MISILKIIQITLFIVLGFFLFYQLGLSVLALMAKRKINFSSKKSRRFAIIIPAHNEENVIAKTIYSLSALVYPKNLFDLFVIADNCTDNTASIARNLGVNVLERSNSEKKGKQQALLWGFDKILSLETSYDAFIVFDVDSLISGNYLEVMNYYLEQGSRVIQGSNLVNSQPEKWGSEAMRISFLLSNYVVPLGRKVLNLEMRLKENGMCFTTRVLNDIPWQFQLLADYDEYGFILNLHGISIEFAPEATVWKRKPAESIDIKSYSKKWKLVQYSKMRRFSGKFIVQFLKKGSFSSLDIVIDLLSPPMANVLFVASLISLINFLLWMVGFLPFLYFILWLSVFATGVLHLLVGLYVAGAEKALYKSLLFMPIYFFGKTKIYLKAVFGKM